MEQIKAIETSFDGYLFRSRLEAKWAHSFKSIFNSYDYELEGFELKSGRYLPDFYIRELDLFVEIKPSFDVITEYDIRRYYDFSQEKRFILICGQPSKHQISLLTSALTGQSLADILKDVQDYSFYELCNGAMSFVQFAFNPLGGVQLQYEDEGFADMIKYRFKESLIERFDGKPKKTTKFPF